MFTHRTLRLIEFPGTDHFEQQTEQTVEVTANVPQVDTTSAVLGK
jgi:hypothetical protein